MTWWEYPSPVVASPHAGEGGSAGVPTSESARRKPASARQRAWRDKFAAEWAWVGREWKRTHNPKGR